MKPRKEYDIQEYKDVLKKQIEEKVLRESQEKKVLLIDLAIDINMVLDKG